MDKAFLIDAMGVLLGLPNLVEVEKALLRHLRASAEMETYWDALGRNNCNPFGKPILINIILKARAAGLGPTLQQLKDAHENVHKHVEDDQDDTESSLSAAPALR